LSEYLDLWRYWRQGARIFAAEDYRLFEETSQRLAVLLGQPVAGQRMLDVGCGQHYPETLLFTDSGNTVTGIDLDVVASGMSLGKYVAIARRNGMKRAIKSLGRAVAFDRLYFAELERLAGHKLDQRRLDLRTADAAALPFAAGTFDLVVSTNAFEHIEDLDGAAAEIGRVLKPGGLAHINIHLYTSVSGGHHLEWTWPERDQPRTVPPWDHLRANDWAVDYYLNRQRQDAYRAAFGRHLDIVQWIDGRREGERYLTPELRAELAGFSVDELLIRSVIVIARRR
jgi:SAM-dependent methyltransferase